MDKNKLKFLAVETSKGIKAIYQTATQDPALLAWVNPPVSGIKIPENQQKLARFPENLRTYFGYLPDTSKVTCTTKAIKSLSRVTR